MTNKNPLIGIIIPVYLVQREHFEKCVTSAINQSYKNIEIIISSPDNKNDIKARTKAFGSTEEEYKRDIE